MRQLSASPKKTLLTKDTTTQRWTVMKEINGKPKQSNKSNFSQKLITDNKIKTGQDKIANEFIKYFADIGPSLAKNIADPSMPFESFLKTANSQSVFINKAIERCLFLISKQTKVLALTK